MKITQILPDFNVSPQISADDVAIAAAHGIKSIICNRPDGEGGPDQPLESQVESAAKAQGIEYRSIPFSAGQQTPEDIKAFASALKEMPSPVLAYCRTGTRSTKIWAQGYAAEHSVQAAIDIAAAAGTDLSADRALLEKAAGAS